MNGSENSGAQSHNGIAPFSITLDLSSRTSEITVSSSPLPLPAQAQGGMLVTDENVLKIHAKAIADLLENRDFGIVSVPAGEPSKSKDRLFGLMDAFTQRHLKRSSWIVAFGGGVVGDLAGLAASLYMRGTRLAQIPTTLLAQIDSSIGGKTAINYGGGKNNLGTFYQPDCVLISTAYLSTLPERELRAGMAEAIKTALTCDPVLAKRLLSLVQCGICDPFSLLKTGDLAWILSRCIEAKARLVRSDERDIGVRRFLNFGHTFGHAIEQQSRFEKYLHGEAVAMGMRMAVGYASALGICDPGLAEDLCEMLKLSFMPQCPIPIGELTEFMELDKKNRVEGEIELVLLARPGEPFMHKTTSRELASVLS